MKNNKKSDNIQAKIILYDNTSGARIMSTNLMDYSDAVMAADRVIKAKYDREAREIRKFMKMSERDKEERRM